MKVIVLGLIAVALLTADAQAQEGPGAGRWVASVDCPADGEILIKKVEAAKSCYEATQLAETCAWGSSFDVGLAGAAGAICEKDFKKITKVDKLTKDHMIKRCRDKYKKAEGTLALSMHSFCNLEVYKFWSRIYTPVET